MPLHHSFKGFPPQVGIAMSMELIPIQVRVKVFLEAIKSTILDITLFQWAMEKISKELFNVATKKHDNTPPEFRQGLAVKQTEDTDFTKLGVTITYEAKDPDSKVATASVFAGSSPGGNDLLAPQPLNPDAKSTFQPVTLPQGKPAYFTVEACNGDSKCSRSSATLPSWDSTLTEFTLTQVGWGCVWVCVCVWVCGCVVCCVFCVLLCVCVCVCWLCVVCCVVLCVCALCARAVCLYCVCVLCFRYLIFLNFSLLSLLHLL